MAAIDPSVRDKAGRYLSVLRCGLTGAVSLSAGFVFYWGIALMNLTGASHFFVALFSPGASLTLGALGLGLVCSTLTGFGIGALIAVTYNAFSFIEDRTT